MNVNSIHPTNHVAKRINDHTENVLSQENNNLTFQNAYIAEYKSEDNDLTLTANINTSNLNLTNTFYFVNYYGPMCSYVPLKWKYNFEVNLPNTSQTYVLNPSKFTYDNLTNETLSFHNLFSYQTNILDLLNNFFNNSSCDLPTVLVQYCEDWNDVSDLLSLGSSFKWYDPDLNFTQYEWEKLFHLNGSINLPSNFSNLNVTSTKNNLFAMLNLQNLNSSYNFNVNVAEINRDFVNLTAQGNCNVQYDNNFAVPIQISIANNLDDYFTFNPNLLLVQSSLSTLDNNLPYTTLPNLNFNLNTNLLNALFTANLAAQLYDLLENIFNNSSLNNLLNELWNKNLFSLINIQYLLNYFGNWSYNPTDNNLSIQFTSNINVNNIINLLQTILSNNKDQASWNTTINNLANSQINLTPLQYINLYQTLLTTYQNAKFEIYFQTKSSEQEIAINYENLMIKLKNTLLNQIILPYEDIFLISKVLFVENNETQNMTLTNNEIKLIKYPTLLNYQINENNWITYKNLNLIPLTSLNLNANSVIFANLETELNLTSAQLINLIDTFDANYKTSTWITSILKNNAELEILKIDVMYSIFNLWNTNSTFLNFLTNNNFNTNLFLNNNQSFISNVQISNCNLSSIGIFNLSFDLNNEIETTNLNNKVINANSINYNEISTKFNADICDNPSDLITNKKLTHTSHQTTNNNKNKKISQNDNNISYVYLYFLIPIVLIILVIGFVILKHKLKTRISLRKYKKHKK